MRGARRAVPLLILALSVTAPGAGQEPSKPEGPDSLRSLGAIMERYVPFEVDVEDLAHLRFNEQPLLAWLEGDPEVRKEALAHLEANRETLEDLTRLILEPDFTLLEHTEPTMTSPIPNYVAARGAARSLSLELHVAASRGEAAVVDSRLAALTRLTATLSRDGISLSIAIAHGLEREVVVPAVRFLLAGDPDPATLERVASRLLDLERGCLPIDEAFRRDFACMARSTSYLREEVSRGLEGRPGAGGEAREEVDRLLDQALAGYEEKLAVLAGDLAGLASEGDVQGVRRRLEAVVARAKAHPAMAELMDEILGRVAGREDLDDAVRGALSEGMADLLVSMVIPDLSRLLENDLIARAERGLLRLLCALLRYHAVTGELPGRIEALVPDFIDVLPAPPSFRLQYDLASRTLGCLPMKGSTMDAGKLLERLRLDLREFLD